MVLVYVLMDFMAKTALKKIVLITVMGTGIVGMEHVFVILDLLGHIVSILRVRMNVVLKGPVRKMVAACVIKAIQETIVRRLFALIIVMDMGFVSIINVNV